MRGRMILGTVTGFWLNELIRDPDTFSGVMFGILCTIFIMCLVVGDGKDA